jgi:calcium-dependent protein kinase
MSSLVGSPYFMAPEVLTGSYDTMCDMWSVGILLGYMITGKHPITGETHDEVFAKIRNMDLKWSRTDWDGISKS